jgi:hypothetical protein
LAITSLLELRAMGSCMAEIMTQLAAWILPPIALPRALPIVIEGGVLEAAVIRSGASKSVDSAVGLVGTPATVEAAPVAARIAKSLALRNKSRRWNAGCGQQMSMYGSRRFVKKFMCEEMAMKICI